MQDTALNTSGYTWSPTCHIPGWHLHPEEQGGSRAELPGRRELAAMPGPQGAAESTRTPVRAWSLVTYLLHEHGGQRDWS